MIRTRIRFAIGRLLIGSCLFALGLVGIIAAELQQARLPSRLPDQPSVVPVPADAVSPPARTPEAVAMAAAEQRQAAERISLARPLFELGRRPPAGIQPSGTVPASLPRLAGVLVSPAGRQVIFAGADGKPAILGEGGRIAGFLVQQIAAGQVTVLGPDGVHVLRPSFDPNRRPATAAAPAPPIAPPPGVAAGPAGMPEWLARSIRGQPTLPPSGSP